MPDERWREQAACRPYNNDWWFPTIVDEEGNEWLDDGTIWEAFGDTTPFYTRAKEICLTCPVKAECLDFALVNKERWGMWGGTTPIERRRVERAARRKRLRERRRLEAEAEADEDE